MIRIRVISVYNDAGVEAYGEKYNLLYTPEIDTMLVRSSSIIITINIFDIELALIYVRRNTWNI